jgi:hypothetical protein
MEVGFQTEPSPEADMYGPYEDEGEGKEELKKKKKKSKEASKQLDGGEVKKKKKSKHHTEDGLKRDKKSKRRSSKIDPESSPADINEHKTHKHKRVSANGPMSHLPGDRNSLAHAAPARLENDAANGVHGSMPQSEGFGYPATFNERTNPPTLQPERTINWETGDGMRYSDDNDVSVITPLTAFEREPSLRGLREDVEDGFVPVATRFSSTSPRGKSERVQHGVLWEESGQGGELRKLSREQRSSEPPRQEPPNIDSKLSPDEKRRVSLPPSLFPIQEKDHDGHPRQQKRKNGPLSLFPVDESYDTGHGATTHQKSSHCLSYSSTGESYAQLDTENGAQGGTVDYVATRRSTTKDIRRKENRENGPSYFASSEQYNDENIRADTQMPSPLDVESQSSDRAGAFSIRRPGLPESTQDSGNLSSEWMPYVDQGEQMTQVAPMQQAVVGPALVADADRESVDTAKNKPTPCYCSGWFKALAVLVVIAAIAAAVAIPLTSSKDDGTVSFTHDQIVARTEQLLPVLTSVSNETQLMNATSPQGAAFMWMASQDRMSPIENESRTPRETELIIQRYTLAVFYYSTMGDNWFSSDGWLDGQREECRWEHVNCVNNDTVSIVTGTRNNLVGAIPSELKDLKELRSLILPSNAITGFSKGIGSLQNLVELNLSRNKMGGTIPMEIYAFTSLRKLLLVENSFTGTVSPLITNLSELSECFLVFTRQMLAVGNLTPTFLFVILLAAELILDQNELSGTLTTEFQASPNLANLDLGNNYFAGNFNTIFSGMDQLGTICLLTAYHWRPTFSNYSLFSRSFLEEQPFHRVSYV